MDVAMFTIASSHWREWYGGIVLVSSVFLLLKYGLIFMPRKIGTDFITKSPKVR